MKKSVWVVLGLMVVIVGAVFWFVQKQPAEQTPNTDVLLKEPGLPVTSTLPEKLAANTIKAADEEEDETFNPYSQRFSKRKCNKWLIYLKSTVSTQ